MFIRLSPSHYEMSNLRNCVEINQAKHCSDAGAVGVLIVNGLDDDMVIMTGDHSEIQ